MSLTYAHVCCNIHSTYVNTVQQQDHGKTPQAARFSLLKHTGEEAGQWGQTTWIFHLGEGSTGRLHQGLMPGPAHTHLGVTHPSQQHSHQEADEDADILRAGLPAAQGVHDSERQGGGVGGCEAHHSTGARCSLMDGEEVVQNVHGKVLHSKASCYGWSRQAALHSVSLHPECF